MNSKVRELQRGLYRAAKENRERVFYSLHDKICRPDVLLAAWQKVKVNGGAPGIDGVSIEQIEEQGIVEYLKQIQDYNIINHISSFYMIKLIFGDTNGYETDQHYY